MPMPFSRRRLIRRRSRWRDEAPDEALEGRVAIVTGGARGIGLAIVEELHRLGAAVLVADSGVSISGNEPDASSCRRRCRESLAAMQRHLPRTWPRPGAADQAVKLAVDNFGALDIVVNNAAILRDAFIFKASRENWEQLIANNLTASFALLAAATPLMREQQKNGRAPGRIVNIVSSAGLFGNFGQSAYASAKAGLVGLTRVVAMDMARSKVACNAIAPFAATRVTATIQPANEAQAAYKERALRIPGALCCAPHGLAVLERARHQRPAVRRARPRTLPVFPAAAGGANADERGHLRGISTTWRRRCKASSPGNSPIWAPTWNFSIPNHSFEVYPMTTTATIEVKTAADLAHQPEEYRNGREKDRDQPCGQRALRRAGVRRARHQAGADALHQVADLPYRDGGVSSPCALQGARRGDRHAGRAHGSRK